MTDNTPAESAAMLEALAAKLAEVEAERDDVFFRGVCHGQNAMRQLEGKTFHVVDSPELAELRARAEAAEAELSRLRTAQDAMVGAVIEQAAHFCHYHAVGLDPRRGYVVDEWTEEMGGKHPGMAYAPAIRALRPDATSALERMLRDARNAERERCQRIVNSVAQEAHMMADPHGVEIAGRIAALVAQEDRGA